MYCGKCGRKLEENEVCNCSLRIDNHSSSEGIQDSNIVNNSVTQSKEQQNSQTNTNQKVSYGEGIDSVLEGINSFILFIKKAKTAILICLLIAVGIFLIYNFTGRVEGRYVSVDRYYLYGQKNYTERTYVLKGGFFKKNCGELEIYEDGERVLDKHEDSEWELEGDILTLEADGERLHFYYTGKEIIKLGEDEDSPEWLGTFEHGDDDCFDLTLRCDDGGKYVFKEDGTVLEYWNAYDEDPSDYEYQRLEDIICFKSTGEYTDTVRSELYICHNKKIVLSSGVYKKQ